MYLKCRVTDLSSLQQVFFGCEVSCRSQQSRKHVFMETDVVNDRAGFNHSRPANETWYAIAAFPIGVLFPAEHRCAPVRPTHRLGTVVGGIHHDRVIGNAQLIKLPEYLSDLAVVLHQTVWIDAETGHALACSLQMRPNVHSSRIPPDEERLPIPVRLLHEFRCALAHRRANRFQPFHRDAGSTFTCVMSTRTNARIGRSFV